ncbi:MAG TPA: DUF1850 domain-containing protein [Geminicoccus sp.]|uniref:DUF1850 domain-containing protein n=1 Tax=Geminicoccus sp. TaxID=2024832 RepID=UPI002E3144D6|nr:DUF1850 domain-containing protein [Geminicoccus sp.]HEX2525343.1 DUF1850 domain-containing protein [Geminicoccus sp.]
MADPLTICLATAGLIFDLGKAEIELRWVHSVQMTRWSEQWRVTEQGLEALSATVEGSGAGMEPGEGAAWNGQGWTWRPALPPQRELVFARSGATSDWQICQDGTCRSVRELTGIEPGAPFRLAPCKMP